MFFFRKKEQPPVCDERLSHIAFIMDGNGRWANRRGLPRNAGHIKGAQVFRRSLDWCKEAEIQTATYYAFSSENFKRSAEEVEGIFSLLGQYIDMAEDENKESRIRFLGDLTRLPKKLAEHAAKLEKDTAYFTDFTVNIALSYGGRNEIVRAANLAISEGKTVLTAEDIASRLYTAPTGDPDLIVRTGGELRLSNFLLWQSAYTEFYFTPTLWPSFTQRELKQIIDEYHHRQRRYGGV